MIFKVGEIEPKVHLIRGYRKKDDIEFCFSCVLHKAQNEKKWHLHLATSDKKGAAGEVKETLKYFKNYPDGVFTYVSDTDWKRFYKKHNFKRICL